MSADPYKVLGVGYADLRRSDPRLAEHIDHALVGAVSIVNVGAGTGSYEPPTRTVLAVEPSRTMIRQRPPGAAPAVQASAEALPLPDGAVDAALAVLTVHHWPDAPTGVAELVRVAQKQVLLTVDPHLFARTLWLVTDYLPEVGHVDAGRPGLDLVVTELERLGRHVEVVPVPVPADVRSHASALTTSTTRVPGAIAVGLLPPWGSGWTATTTPPCAVARWTPSSEADHAATGRPAMT